VGSRAARRVGSPPHRARRPAGWRLPSSATRERVFDEQNVDGTGLSLAHAEQAVQDLAPGMSNRPALQQAFEAARQSAPGNLQPAPAAGRLSKEGFQRLLRYLRYFDRTWARFETVLATSDEGRLSNVKAFSDACAQIGCPLSKIEAATVRNRA
jgi:hypothetical protein